MPPRGTSPLNHKVVNFYFQELAGSCYLGQLVAQEAHAVLTPPGMAEDPGCCLR
jgi:hypothetical protein